jgi:hypothetical protein
VDTAAADMAAADMAAAAVIVATDTAVMALALDSRYQSSAVGETLKAFLERRPA